MSSSFQKKEQSGREEQRFDRESPWLESWNQRPENILEKVSSAAVELVHLPRDDDIFDFIAEKLGELLGDVIIAVNAVDPEHWIMVTRRLLGLRTEELVLVAQKIGEQVPGIAFRDIDEKIKELLYSGRLHPVEGGLYGALFHQVPKQDCEEIERFAGIREAYSIGLRREGKLFGNVTLFTRTETPLKKDVVESFVNLASVVLEARSAEAALRQTEERLELALQGADLGLWNWNVQSGELVTNARCAEMLGYALEEMQPHIRSWKNQIHPDDYPYVTASLNAHLSGETPGYETEHRVRSKSGEWRWILSRGKVVERDQAGAPLRAAGSQIDITRRKKAEEDLQARERLHRNLLHNLNAGVVAHAPDSSILACNPRSHEILGLTHDQMIGKTAPDPHWKFFREDGTEMSLEEYPVNRVLSTRVTLKNYMVGVRKPDTEGLTWVLVNGFPVLNEKGELEQAVINFIDVTDIKLAEQQKIRMEEQVRQSQKMEAIGRLAGGVSHDLNNVLTAITAYSDLLLMGLKHPDDPLREDAEEIRRAVERATALTNQLLAFSRKQVLLPKVLDLNAVFGGMENMFRRLLGEEIELVARLGKGLGSVRADPGQIEQIIMNLTLNARDAMPRGGKLTIETADVNLDAAYACDHLDVRPGCYVMLSVADTGVGMDTETRAHIFEPFFTKKGELKGTGLGLATVYGIVKQSEGHIWVYSEPGHGSTVKIYLPRVEAVPDSVEPAPAPAEPLGGSQTILLVEDEAAVRKALREILQRSGYTVLDAAGPDEAILTMERQETPIHMMITDVVMPKMRGPELARKLEARHPDMKVLYVSGYTDNAIVQHGILDPGLNFLSKPFSMQDLLMKVQQVLGGSPVP